MCTARQNMGPARFCLLIIALCIQEISSCEDGWTSYDGHCYYFATTEVNWATASASCKSHNAHLAIVDNEYENNFLQQFAMRYTSGHSNVHFWLDGSDSVHEGHWIWTESGQRLSYTDWAPSQPSHSKHSLGCMALSSQMHFKWDVMPCGNSARYICEVGGRWVTFG